MPERGWAQRKAPKLELELGSKLGSGSESGSASG
ncbi:MAG: hypothetical protein QOE85_2302, partial [Actinomycetota bacterium]|nr:hypothetical protein [Actinomycetota bacterium]